MSSTTLKQAIHKDGLPKLEATLSWSTIRYKAIDWGDNVIYNHMDTSMVHQLKSTGNIIASKNIRMNKINSKHN
jgi:hypothetical protein